MSENGNEIRELLATLERLGVTLEIEGDQILCHVTGAGLPQHIQDAVRQNKQSLLKHLRRLGRLALVPKLSFGTVSTNAPLSSIQRRIWFHERLHADSPFYSMPLALRVRGPLDPAQLRLAWQHVLARHPALESVLLSTDQSMQCVQRGCGIPMEIVDWRGRPETSDCSLLTQELARIVKPLKAHDSALAVAHLYLLAAEDHLLLITLHHLVADGWSSAIVVEDLFGAYEGLQRGDQTPLAPLGANYFDYVSWHGAYEHSGAFEQDLAYWQRVLEGAPHTFDPLQSNSAAASLGHGEPTHCRERLACEPGLHDVIAAWARRNGGTVHSFLLSAWSALLHHWAACDDVVVGTVVAGRPSPEFERVVGCFINALPMRVRIKSEFSFEAHHADIVESLLAAYEHQHCPLERIVQTMNPERARDSNPLFNTGLLLQNYPMPQVQGSELEFNLVPFERHGGSLDLRLVAGMVEGEFVLVLEYNVAWLDLGAARDLLQAYVSLLRGLLNQTEAPLRNVLVGLDWGSLRVRRRVVIGANFTVEPIAGAFEFWRREVDLPYALTFAPYDQVIQSLLDPASRMRRHSDHNCLFIRVDEWLFEVGNVSPGVLVAKTDLFIDACLEYQAQSYVPLTVWLCPTSRRALETPESATALKDAHERLRMRLSTAPRVRLHWPESYASKYDFTDAEDEYTASLGHIPYRQKIYTALGTLLARELSAWSRPPVKVIVLDADNTIWRGVCGEDGASGVQFDAAALDLQRFFLAMRTQGVALCLCSKNSESDVRQVFETRAECLLRWADFSARRVNWQPKSHNIRSIAEELNIGLDTVVFIDDNPTECSEVEAHCPEVLCLQLPGELEEIPSFLRGVWELDVVQPAPGASLRLETYRLNAERAELKRENTDLQDFLRKLAIRTTLRPMRDVDFQRASELTRRTTQFNFSGRHKSEAEIAAFSAGKCSASYVVEVEDCFGAYGITGVLLCELKPTCCFIETFVLSCRVLGKNVERAVLEQLERAVHLRVGIVRADLLKTTRNQPAEAFAASFFGAPVLVDGSLMRYEKSIPEWVEI